MSLSWTDITPNERIYKIMRADSNPLYFWTDDYFLGQELWPKQEELGVNFYQGNYKEFILVAGQRSSKTYMLGSMFATYELFKLLVKDYVKIYHLAKDSPLFITLVAAAEKQIEDTAFFQLRARMINSPFFAYYQPNYTTDSITFPRTKPNVIVRALASISLTAAGRTNKAALMDEVGGLKDTDGAMSGMRVYDKLANSTETFGPEGHMFCGGSPENPSDILMRLKARGEHNPRCLVVHEPTWVMNPYMTRESLRDIELNDPVRFWRDFGADPQGIADIYYRNLDVLRFDSSRPNALLLLSEELEFNPPVQRYVLSGDPALKHDAFGLCLAHSEFKTYVIDGIMRFQPVRGREIDPIEVTKFILKVADIFPISDAVFDTWHFAEMQQRLQQRGILVHNHIVRKPEHDHVKEKFYTKEMICPYYQPLEDEMKQLLIRSDLLIDHPRGGSKDVADALANACWLLKEQEVVMTPFNIVRVM